MVRAGGFLQGFYENLVDIQHHNVLTIPLLESGVIKRFIEIILRMNVMILRWRMSNAL